MPSKNPVLLPADSQAGLFFPGKSSSSNVLATIWDGRYLPHWEADYCIYQISFRLADSVPQTKLNAWRMERQQLLSILQDPTRTLTDDECRRLLNLHSQKVEAFLDSGYGSCLLKVANIAEIVANALRHRNQSDYLLHAWCIMPNHVHVIVQVLKEISVSHITQIWKSVTAHHINRLLRRNGTLWQADSYNHIIRTAEEYYCQINYVWENPTKAGFPVWKWRWKCLDE